MRTTVDIEDSLLLRAKEEAVRERKTLREIIEEALREKLLRRRKDGGGERTVLPVSDHGGGVRPGVDVSDSSGLLEIMETGDGFTRR